MMGIHLQLMLLGLLPYVLSYPVFGTKRYGRSWGASSPYHVPQYYYQIPHQYPLSYYDINPYAQDYQDEYYYPQEAMNYAVYYRNNPKYDYYQPAVPYYYGRNYPRYSYYDAVDPVDDLQEEILQEEREEREEALPIGQETWYETDPEENIDDVNAAFLQNLMIYNDAMKQSYDYPPQDFKDYDYETYGYDGGRKYEDDDVKELKKLADKPKKQNKNKKQRLEMFEKQSKKQKVNNKDLNDSENWIRWNSKRNEMKNEIDPIANLAFKKLEVSDHGPVFADTTLKFSSRKPKIAKTTGTEAPVTSSAKPQNTNVGQKEVVLMRPATPVRRPFSEPVMELLAKQSGNERKRTPSVYDTIKRLLEMEKNLEEEQHYQKNQLRPQMRKRYVSNEDNLVEQLSGLKKTA